MYDEEGRHRRREQQADDESRLLLVLVVATFFAIWVGVYWVFVHDAEPSLAKTLAKVLGVVYWPVMFWLAVRRRGRRGEPATDPDIDDEAMREAEQADDDLPDWAIQPLHRGEPHASTSPLARVPPAAPAEPSGRDEDTRGADPAAPEESAAGDPDAWGMLPGTPGDGPGARGDERRPDP